MPPPLHTFDIPTSQGCSFFSVKRDFDIFTGLQFVEECTSECQLFACVVIDLTSFFSKKKCSRLRSAFWIFIFFFREKELLKSCYINYIRCPPGTHAFRIIYKESEIL